MPRKHRQGGPAEQPEAMWETPAGTLVGMVELGLEHQDHLVTYGCGRCHQCDSLQYYCLPVKRCHPQLGTITR